MIKALILVVLLACASAYNYPLYKQCDPQWGSDTLGTSPTQTICSAGCLLSSAAMALKGFGQDFNPKTLNIWLTNNKGYVSGDLFVWASINTFGLTFKGFISNAAIKKNIDDGNVVIINVRNGGHWVLVNGYSGSSLLVNDAGYSVSSYDLSQVVDGNTGVYTVNKIPNFLNNWILSVQDFVAGLIGTEKSNDVPPVRVSHEVGIIRPA